jgi:hypothetical protein
MRSTRLESPALPHYSLELVVPQFTLFRIRALISADGRIEMPPTVWTEAACRRTRRLQSVIVEHAPTSNSAELRYRSE